MISSFRTLHRLGAVGALLAAGALHAGACAADDQPNLAQQIFETMVKTGAKPGFRTAHAKGIVCEGAFTAAKGAAALSKAAHFHGAAVPIIVRFSNAATDPSTPDTSPNAGPRGIAIRFNLSGGGRTDIVALSHNGFVVGNGEDFLALQKAVVATDPSQPHPWPIEAFLGAHPVALKFVQESAVVPVSYGTLAYFSNNAFIFVNQAGVKQAGRYQILPAAGLHNLSDADAKAKPADFLADELRARLKTGPVKYRMVVQLANPGDPTNDGSIVWPADRRTIELGTVSITAVDADSDAAQKALVFFPTTLTDGIELSDDPLPSLRTSVYALSFARRQQQQ
jgi:catalase